MLTQNGLMDKEKQKFLTEVLRQPYTSSIPKKWEDNKEIVLATMKFNGHLLQDASLRLKDDKEVVLAAIRDKAYTLNYASARLRDDKEVVLAAVRKKTWSLNKASSRLKDDKEVVLTSVRGNGASFKFASARLKDDEEVVLTSVRTAGYALMHASPRILNNKEFVLVAIAYAVKNYERAFEFLSTRLQNDIEVVEAALTSNIHSIEHLMNVETLDKLNPSLFTQEDRISIYNFFIQAEAQHTQGKHLFLHAKMKRHFLS